MMPRLPSKRAALCIRYSGKPSLFTSFLAAYAVQPIPLAAYAAHTIPLTAYAAVRAFAISVQYWIPTGSTSSLKSYAGWCSPAVSPLPMKMNAPGRASSM
jgi:hypothetical protein